MKKIKVFGKGIPVFAIAILGLALVSAALLSYYGTITGSAVVSQSVKLNNGDYNTPITWSKSFVAGESVVNCSFNLKNHAGVEAPIMFGTTCRNTAGFDDGTRNEVLIDWATFSNDRCDGIVTEIYGVLELTNKDPSDWTWTPTGGMKATMYYTILGNSFKYDLEAIGLEPSTGYILIYYADEPDRFVEWGGNPALNLGVATSNDAGYLKLSDSLGIIPGGLPYSDDWNTGKYENTTGGYADYCTSDGYQHCTGAKIWLIPSSDWTSGGGRNGKLNTWNPTNYLFETDLIVYSNDASNVITLPANGGGFNFCVENTFALNLVPDTYTLETKILPAA